MQDKSLSINFLIFPFYVSLPIYVVDGLDLKKSLPSTVGEEIE